MLYYPVDAGTHRGVVSLSELNGVVPSTLFGVFCPLEGWGSRTCEGFGVNAGFEGVHGGSGLAYDRGGASGFLGVTTVGFYLTKGRHGFARVRASLGWTGQEACPTLSIGERSWEFGG